MFHPMSDEARVERQELVRSKYAVLDAQLSQGEWLMGDAFTVADAYLFTLTNWAQHTGVDLSANKAVQDFQARAFARPAIQSALKAEGLIPAE